ncbi:MAG: cellobiose phosphorylase, partial [Anaerolineae bacterium]
LAYTVTDYELIPDANGEPRLDEQGRPYVRAIQFEPTVLPLFLEGPVHALKVQPDRATARELHAKIKASDLYDGQLGMYKVNASLEEQSHELGRARAFAPGWLENESIWLHMEYKYLLEVLKAGLYEEFYEEFERILICFQNPEVYGRSPLENSSFLVSSAHPDPSLHGTGFVARLSGATAEFLSIWTTMMAGPQPFFLRNGNLCLAFKPILPGWLFDAGGRLSFTFLGHTPVTIHNPDRVDTWRDEGAGSLHKRPTVLYIPGQGKIEFADGIVPAPYAEMVRAGQVEAIELFLA